jgi:hypothetical protein
MRTQEFIPSTVIWMITKAVLVVFTAGLDFVAIVFNAGLAGVIGYVIFKLIALDPDKITKAVVLSVVGFMVIPMLIMFGVEALMPDLGPPIKINWPD